MRRGSRCAPRWRTSVPARVQPCTDSRSGPGGGDCWRRCRPTSRTGAGWPQAGQPVPGQRGWSVADPPGRGARLRPGVRRTGCPAGRDVDHHPSYGGGVCAVRRLLAREDSRRWPSSGTGVQAQAHAEAMVRVRPVKLVRVAGRNPEHVTALCSGARGLAGAGRPARRQLRRCVRGRGHRLRRDPCRSSPRSGACPSGGGARDLGGLQHRRTRGGLRDRGGRTRGRRVPCRRTR